jgi:outer membrane protein OmpA-like peptidoglycan-associated protein
MPVISPSGQVGLKYAESAKTLGAGRLAFSAFGSFTLDDKFCKLVKLSDSLVFLPSNQFNFIPNAGFGVFDFLDVSALLPLYFDLIQKFQDTAFPHRSFGEAQGGLGDLELRFKLHVPPRTLGHFLDLALLGGMSVPTGDRVHGFFPRHTYYFLHDSTVLTDNKDTAQAYSACFSSAGPEIITKALLTFSLLQKDDFTALSVHLNCGFRLMTRENLENVFLFAAAVEYHPTSWFCVYGEASAEERLKNVFDGFTIGRDPLRFSPGISFTLPEGAFLTFGGDVSLSGSSLQRYEAKGGYLLTRIQPDLQISAAIGWSGFPGGSERMQKQKKNADSDNDGIPDSLDKCPMLPEDYDGFQDNDGCPDYDNDNDHIPDTLDRCPNAAEDYDGFQDNDGCPDYDNDRDGVPDSLDRCPNIPEDIDGFEDGDGCPDYDNDLDGVLDSLDKCPNEAGKPEYDGCPNPQPQQEVQPPQSPSRAKEIKRGRLILKGVDFKRNTADLTTESYATLDDLYESLKAFPEVTVEISGHTDNAGNATANKKLSLRKAETVRAYLILRGIDPLRVKAVGRGGEDPVADNKTAEGRAFNRRSEIRRID